MVLYGIASRFSRGVDDFYVSREEAESALAEIVADEPDFKGALWVEPIEFELSQN